ncbi:MULTISPECIES: hypothetical protein [unclassified Coleofasciculus]|uniref:hypothetical protein n=1 Tax=unclassified Coleofasciculus TaxID=2692782 RepID=UPI00187E120F|nr:MULTISPECIES: hypothetical protein [unclassified Coleofasciculus]MBE9125814.1 hypothetical protein [Coleofasciculus sp. LEGE 07081]MBE9149001.1 hypothetical protein [Coleofasciculus sp. LEGE 07092]
MIKFPSLWPWISSLGQYGNPEILTGIQLVQRIKVLCLAAYELIQFCLPFIFIIVLCIGLKLVSCKTKNSMSIGEWFCSNRWSILILVTMYMIPISLLSRVKFGGATNSQASTVYFLVCTVTALINDSVFKFSYNRLDFFHILKGLKISVLSIAVLLATTVYLHAPNKIYRELNRYSKNPVELAYRYTLKHPHQIYFPQIPLSILMADGRLYHSFNGLWDREKAGLKLSNDHFQAYIPSKLQVVAFYHPKDIEVVMGYLPNFSKQTTVDTLPKWVIFTKEE